MFCFVATKRKFRNVSAIAVGLAYLFVAVGWLPILKKPIKNSDSQRYPCQGCACSCNSAIQCWTSCCCFTIEERIAWAEANGIEIPGFVLAKAEVDERKCCCSCSKKETQNQNEQNKESRLAITVPKCFKTFTQWIASQSILIEIASASHCLQDPPWVGSVATKACTVPAISEAPPEPIPIFHLCDG